MSRSTRPGTSFVGLVSLFLVNCTGPVEEVATELAAPSTPVETPSKPAAAPFAISWGSCTIPNGDAPIEAECAIVDAPARRGRPHRPASRESPRTLRASNPRRSQR